MIHKQYTVCNMKFYWETWINYIHFSKMWKNDKKYKKIYRKFRKNGLNSPKYYKNLFSTKKFENRGKKFTQEFTQKFSKNIHFEKIFFNISKNMEKKIWISPENHQTGTNDQKILKIWPQMAFLRTV